MHKPIRDIRKRFQIVLYHLEKICEDWGQCAGLSASDVTHIQIGPLAELKRLFKSKNIWAYDENPFIPEEEFDNKPQADTVLEAKNKRLEEELKSCRNVILNIQKQFE